MKIEMEKVEVIPTLPAPAGERTLIMENDEDGLLDVHLKGDQDDEITIVLGKSQVELLRDSLTMFLNHTNLESSYTGKANKTVRNL